MKNVNEIIRSRTMAGRDFLFQSVIDDKCGVGIVMEVMIEFGLYLGSRGNGKRTYDTVSNVYTYIRLENLKNSRVSRGTLRYPMLKKLALATKIISFFAKIFSKKFIFP